MRLTNPTVFIRTDAGPAIGWGHLIRCSALAAEFARRGSSPVFCLKYHDQGAVDFLRGRGYRVELLNAFSWREEAQTLHGLAGGPAVFLFDFSHSRTFADEKELPSYFADLKSSNHSLAVIDGLFAQALADRLALGVDWLIVPYVGGKSHFGKKFRELKGPAYFVCSPEFLAVRRDARKVAARAERVLLTFGGSDPHGISGKAVAALEVLPQRLTVRLVLGASFAPSLVRELRQAVVSSRHAYELLEAPDNLAEPMAWADLAIASTGLTKYELALCGAPSVLLSIDQPHADIHREFAEIGTSWHLGVHSEVSVSTLSSAIARILDDGAKRQEMCDAGQSLVDGRGAQRLVDELIRKGKGNETND